MVTLFHQVRRLAQDVREKLVNNCPDQVLHTSIRETSALIENPDFYRTLMSIILKVMVQMFVKFGRRFLYWENPLMSREKKSINTEKSSEKSKVNNIIVLGHSVDEVALNKGYTLATEVLGEAVEDFYQELFNQYPEVQSIFGNANEKSLVSKLSSALKLLVENLHDEASLVSALTEMGLCHQRYGALPEHYPIVSEMLVSSLKNKIGRSWTKAISSSWMTLLGAVAETMCAAYIDELESEQATDHSVLILKGVQDISKSQSLKNDMLMLVNDNDEIDIDGSSVERIDGSALQLICALFFYAEQNNLIINWIEPSDALIRSSKILGVNKILELS